MCNYRVTYADTDAMGVAYHSNYFKWFEMGRTEYLRNLGIPYKEIEKKGFLLPVVSAYCKYIKPARYDDLLRIETMFTEVKRASIKIHYEIFLEDSEIELVNGYTMHALTDKEGKIRRIPDFIIKKISPVVEK
jgi:acyl-CoA thioester hydrolase